jgi:ketosteroid isomerase-like protein
MPVLTNFPRFPSARLAAGALLLALAAPVTAHGPTHAAPPGVVPAAARGAAATVDAFHAALRRGDTAAASRLLTDDALIFEAGDAERSKAEYAEEHLPADAEFSRAVASTITRRTGGSDGKIAWIATEARSTGNFRGRAIDSSTVETMLLRRVGGAWKIAHIHWSSAARRPAVAATGAPLLAGSAPANGEMVRGPLRDLELRFSPPARLVEVTVAGPGGQMPMMLSSAGEQARYLLPLPPLGPGTYTVDWRAAAGGREDRGTLVFTIR